jgi:polysaccharide chain length determinant protein (PEP-CTERM system associated)
MAQFWLQLRELLPSLWKHRWWGFLATLATGLIGTVVVFSIPSRYEANARVYVDTQSILKPLMAGLAVQPNLDQQVQMMARTLVSRPNVERVLAMSDLDLKTMDAKQREAMLDDLMKEIVFKAAGGNNLYTVSYRNEVPDSARKVVQSLLSIFVEANLGDKRKDGEQARRFIDEQIGIYEKRLVDAENALKDFKIRNIDVMPRLSADYVATANSAQKESDAARLELRQLENSREALRRQLSDEKPQFVSTEPAPGSRIAAGPRPPSEAELRAETARKKLEELTLRYTDEHPDVIIQRRVVRDLDQLADAERRAIAAGTVPTASVTTTIIPNKVYQDIKVSLADTESKIAALRARVADADTRLAQSRAAVSTIPKIEAEYTQLNRDYEINKKNYEALISRRESAAISGEMDSKSGVGEFRVVDPPRVTSLPVFPNRPLLLTGVLLASLAAGIALAFVLQQVRPVFFDGRNLRKVSSMPLLGSVSLLSNPVRAARERRELVVFSGSAAAYLIVFGLLIAWLASRLFIR